MKGEVALVTGASRGIGRAIAQELSRRGMKVAGTATTPKGAESMEEGILGLVMDVTDPSSILAGIREVEERLGTIHTLVNNAGITRDNLLMRMKDEEWASVIDTNLTAVYRLSKACLKGMMKARRGRIINIASVVAVMGNAGQTNYAAAKAGMLGFTKALAREVAPRGITVNAVAPGFIETDMTRALPEERRRALLQMIPLGRLGDPLEVAHAVAFLASPEAAYVTGTTLHVNGGMVMP
ncbi:MAG: 3-oxoacyl-ACP reductase FabG [Gammaproteobacteria bacterium]|nr:MAG: 3-oxoacyl-ACP reductase FabG [Gammaproteobacteria bacterium]